MSTIDDHTGVRLADIRRGVAQLLGEAQATAWESLRSQEAEMTGIPIERFARFVEGLADFDRALAILDRQAATGARVSG